MWVPPVGDVHEADVEGVGLAQMVVLTTTLFPAVNRVETGGTAETTTVTLLLADTFPARSRAHAYKVLVPVAAVVYEVGAVVDHVWVVVDGWVLDSVMM
jgi:hypothetical protein